MQGDLQHLVLLLSVLLLASACTDDDACPQELSVRAPAACSAEHRLPATATRETARAMGWTVVRPVMGMLRMGAMET